MPDDLEIETRSPSADEERLVEAATGAARTAFDPGREGGAHLVGAAVGTADGRTFTGASLPASVGRVSECAEPAAIGSAVADGAEALETVAAVRHPLPEEDRGFEVVPPCGACRELLADYDCSVVVPHDGERVVVDAVDLLPTRTW